MITRSRLLVGGFSLALILSAIGLSLEQSVEAQGASYVRQNNPVARQSLQLAPGTITDAGADALYENTVTPAMYEYPGRCAWNGGTQHIMCYRDGGTGGGKWEDVGGTPNWDYAGTYLIPSDQGAVNQEDIQVGIGRNTTPDPGQYLQVGNVNADRGHVYIQGHAADDVAAELKLTGRNTTTERLTIDTQYQSSTGRQLTNINWYNGEFRFSMGNGAQRVWYFGEGAGATWGHWIPGTDNVYDIGNGAVRVRHVYTTMGISGNDAGTLSLSTTGSVQKVLVNTSGHLYPLQTNMDVGLTSKRWRTGYFDSLDVTNGILLGTTLTVGQGGTGLTTVGTDYLLTGNGAGALSAEADLTFSSTALVVNNHHILSDQTTAPTTDLTGTTLNDGGGSGAACVVTVGGTDSAGHVTITAGNGTPGAGLACLIVFDMAYVTAPKSVQLTCADFDCANRDVYVSARIAASFSIAFAQALAASEVVELTWWVVGGL